MNTWETSGKIPNDAVEQSQGHIEQSQGNFLQGGAPQVMFVGL